MSSSPIQPNQRIQYLDVLRGFAITGVLFAYVFWNLGTEPESAWSAFDKVINDAGYFLVDSKFYTTLACLFTVGFVMHMARSDDQENNLRLYRRRLLGLLIFGIFHTLFLRSGDILVQYSVLTLLITFLYKVSNKVIIGAMIVTFLAAVFIPLSWSWLGFSFPHRPSPKGESFWIENFARVKFLYSIAIFYWETTLFLLLSGLLVGKIFIQKKIKLKTSQLWIIIIAGLVIGAISFLLPYAYAAQLENLPDIGNTYIMRSTVFQSLDILHKGGIASAYAGILYLLSRKFKLTALANMGRMSLTNYISQSLFFVPFCLLFNLFDHVTPTIALVMFIVMWTLQALFSHWWLQRHKFGPLEWLLRRFTYGKISSRTRENIQVELAPGSMA